jgi:hypothetical protein
MGSSDLFSFMALAYLANIMSFYVRPVLVPYLKPH